MFKYIDPEVSGGVGKGTLMNSAVHPPVVYELHYEFYGWMGDDIVESFPCYLVTRRLKERIINRGLSGVVFDEVKVIMSDTFREHHPKMNVPEFSWMKINGVAGESDFGMSKDARLVISPKAWTILQRFNLNHADVENYV